MENKHPISWYKMEPLSIHNDVKKNEKKKKNNIYIYSA